MDFFEFCRELGRLDGVASNPVRPSRENLDDRQDGTGLTFGAALTLYFLRYNGLSRGSVQFPDVTWACSDRSVLDRRCFLLERFSDGSCSVVNQRDEMFGIRPSGERYPLGTKLFEYMILRLREG